jgi:hypothetical protein
MAKGKKPKFEPEAFLVTAIHGTDSFYYTAKIVGSRFKTNIDSNVGRRAVVEAFVHQVPMDKLVLDVNGHGEEMRAWVIGLIKDNAVTEREEYIGQFMRVRPEPSNIFDPNAIAVYANATIGGKRQFWDIGYLPRTHVAKLKEEWGSYHLIGIIPEGIGFRLHFVLSSMEEPSTKPVKGGGKGYGFVQTEMMSLKNLRKSLEVKGG